MDRAAFAIGLTERLRAHGVRVDLDAAATLSRALAVAPPSGLDGLYWTLRVCLVRRRCDLAAFDSVFAAVFGDGVPGDESTSPLAAPRSRADGSPAPDPGPEQEGTVGAGLPWVTLPPASGEPQESAPSTTLPELLPSELEALARAPFDQLSETETAQLGTWLAQLGPRLPRRRVRRRAAGRSGRGVALRPTLARARRTGWEPLELVRTRPVTRPRRVVVLCDVSGSMRAQASAYVHLMRAFALAVETEAFAFGTRLTRLTPLLREGTAEAAVARATGAVDDRFGGTRIAANLRTLLASRHGVAVRGAVVVVASDGWDGDAPEAMTAAMERLRRRAHRVVWANPRAAAPGFEPTVSGMAAALPFCHALLPAHTFAALKDVVEAVARESALSRSGGRQAGGGVVPEGDVDS
ncbi:vWA domain-containing protein [Nocardiopsis valliformis]|uniref:vWA domain-containing protein n=1 Tax=Nocardiopsis valliformis TaxID=239974 RepID=UPI0003698213|nr:VWA domain-containing protein [Nocardiopsis valliformis]